MKGLFIPEITSEMFRNGCLESIETLMAEGEIYDIDYQQPCEDAVSRQAVIDAIKEYASMIWKEYLEPFPESTIIEIIQALPSVKPQPKTRQRLCKTCIYGDKTEYDKPCIIYSDNCQFYRADDVLDKIRAEIKALSPEPTAYDVVDGSPIKDAVWETLADVLKILDRYKAESEVEK